MLNDILILDQQWLPNRSDFPPISWPWYRAWPSPIMSGFHGAFATGVACQQGTLTLPDTWFRPPFWDLLMLQLLRPNSSNLPCRYLTFHLEYPLVLSRFCLRCRLVGSLFIRITIKDASVTRPFMGRLACIWITVAFNGSNIFKFLLCLFLKPLFIHLFLALLHSNFSVCVTWCKSVSEWFYVTCLYCVCYIICLVFLYVYSEIKKKYFETKKRTFYKNCVKHGV